jgi:hypothetical protein
MSDLHRQIMNLRCVAPKEFGINERIAYAQGHRDARHAAAGIASASAESPTDFAANHLTPEQALATAKEAK